MAVKEGWRGRFFEDFEVGDVYPHPLGRTVTTTDQHLVHPTHAEHSPYPLRPPLRSPDGVPKTSGRLHLHPGPGHGAKRHRHLSERDGEPGLR